MTRRVNPERPLTRPEISQRYRDAHPGRATEQMRKWRQKLQKENPERWEAILSRNRVNVLRDTVMKRYNLTLEEYNDLISRPCGLCGTTERPRVPDHDHETNIIRGPLCVFHNNIIGVLERLIREGILDKALLWVERGKFLHSDFVNTKTQKSKK